MRLRMRTLANVPRVITLSLPRLEPKELKSLGSTPRARRYFPAGPSGGMEPAGEMWSVVTESPRIASGRRPDSAGASLLPTDSKNGGFCM